MGTLIGTPPNLVFANAIEDLGRTHPEISIGITPDFPTWLGFGVPIVVIFVPLIVRVAAWMWLAYWAGDDEIVPSRVCRM